MDAQTYTSQIFWFTRLKKTHFTTTQSDLKYKIFMAAVWAHTRCGWLHLMWESAASWLYKFWDWWCFHINMFLIQSVFFCAGAAAFDYSVLGLTFSSDSLLCVVEAATNTHMKYEKSWLSYKRTGLAFGLCPVWSHGVQPSNQVVFLKQAPQTWLQGGVTGTPPWTEQPFHRF